WLNKDSCLYVAKPYWQRFICRGCNESQALGSTCHRHIEITDRTVRKCNHVLWLCNNHCVILQAFCLLWGHQRYISLTASSCTCPNSFRIGTFKLPICINILVSRDDHAYQSP